SDTIRVSKKRFFRPAFRKIFSIKLSFYESTHAPLTNLAYIIFGYASLYVNNMALPAVSLYLKQTKPAA
ncbi:hypothetical protein, partial [[Clostridium] symbiosum]|uniref:hypothetical protein n=1 Tax=Clostridium symbiosum TaxID=1512 RepID=UPI001C00A30A